ncbi:MAG TPA: Sec-independent protein translocase subunit TatA [Pseudonocardiaceae bacterium]|jgi:sec-independent protein translocase protein TatA|nr:Sec-independent protein translocase subunit TatA [Pseudonocardiaceae bacterium]
MGELSPWHWIIVLLIFALLFGSKRLPDAARGLGRSLRIFRAEMRSANEEPPSQPPAPPVPLDAVPTDAVPEDPLPTDAVPTPPSAIPPVAPAPPPVVAMSDQMRPVVDH